MPETRTFPVRLHNRKLATLLIYGIGPIAWLVASLPGYIMLCGWCLRLTRTEVQRPDGRWVRANPTSPVDWTVR